MGKWVLARDRVWASEAREARARAPPTKNQSQASASERSERAKIFFRVFFLSIETLQY